MKENPFQYGKPVHDPKDFFGRDREIRDIYRQILTSHSVSLIGERKIGKTSLLIHLIHPHVMTDYDISTEDILMFYINMSSRSLAKSSDVFRSFLECISIEISGEIKKVADLLLDKEHIHFRQFEEIISMINNNNKKIVFFLDEFEEISRAKEGDIFSKLRYLAQMYEVVFVVSTLRDLRSLFVEERFATSPFFNIFTNYQLSGLDEDASRELITVNFQQEDFNVNPSVIDSIIRFSGTNPFFLKIACHFYFERVINGSYAFDDNLRDFLQQELEPHHTYNWEHLTRYEQAALLDIVREGNTNDSFAIRSLERKGYIAKGRTGFYITSESFQSFLEDIQNSHSYAVSTLDTQIVEINAQDNLRKSDKNALREAANKIQGQKLHLEDLRAPVYEVTGYFELELREYVKNVLESALGSDWFKGTLDRKSREEIEKRISKARRKEKNFEYPENPFQYAILENLRDTILRRDNWEHYFSEYFEDKQLFEVKMNEIVKIRNQVAHYHSIHFNEAVIVIQNILWILNRMRKLI